MADWFYSVRVARDEDLVQWGASNLLVQLVCENHLNANFHETDREASACEIAVKALENRYGSEAISVIGYKEVSRYSGNFPMNLSTETCFTAPCGCRAWII
jgi:hypothetical protein